MQKVIDYIRHNPGIFIVVLVCLLLGYNTLSAVLRNYELQGRVDKLKDEITLLELENNQLDYNNQYYRTDAYLERRARESLNLREPDEEVVLVPRRDPDSSEGQSSKSESLSFIDQSKKNFQEWIDLFSGQSRSRN